MTWISKKKKYLKFRIRSLTVSVYFFKQIFLMFNKTFTITLLVFLVETPFPLISVTSSLIATENDSGLLLVVAPFLDWFSHLKIYKKIRAKRSWIILHRNNNRTNSELICIYIYIYIYIYTYIYYILCLLYMYILYIYIHILIILTFKTF